MNTTRQHYDRHLARVYSWMVGGSERALSAGVDELAALGIEVPAGARVVDLGAGFGTHAIPLARAGAVVVAIDDSRELLDELEHLADGVAVECRHGEFTTELASTDERIDLILCMGDTLTHLDSMTAVRRLAEDAVARLRPGGKFAVTFRDYSTQSVGERLTIPVRSDDERIATCVLDFGLERVTVHDILHERVDGDWRPSSSRYDKVRVDPAWLADLLRSLGCTVEQSTTPTRMIALVATRGEGPVVRSEERAGLDAETIRHHEQNRASWNEATRAHNSHKPGQAAFLRDGGSTLFPEERALLGDVSGRRVLHLLCNSGQDSLSIAALGAEVTGVDISDEAISTAKQLSDDSGIPGEFIRSDVYDWLASAVGGGPRFDDVFVSYGALPWLFDIPRFADGVARLLRPDGRFVAIEFHPFGWVFDEELRPVWPYFSSAGPIEDEGVDDYVAEAGAALAPSGFATGEVGFKNPHRSVAFPWGLGEIVSSFIDAGCVVTHLDEYSYSNGCQMLPGLVVDDQRRFQWPEGQVALPLMFSLIARKRG